MFINSEQPSFFIVDAAGKKKCQRRNSVGQLQRTAERSFGHNVTGRVEIVDVQKNIVMRAVPVAGVHRELDGKSLASFFETGFDDTAQGIAVLSVESALDDGKFLNCIRSNGKIICIGKRIVDGYTVDRVRHFVGTSSAKMKISLRILNDTCLRGEKRRNIFNRKCFNLSRIDGCVGRRQIFSDERFFGCHNHRVEIDFRRRERLNQPCCEIDVHLHILNNFFSVTDG